MTEHLWKAVNLDGPESVCVAQCVRCGYTGGDPTTSCITDYAEKLFRLEQLRHKRGEYIDRNTYKKVNGEPVMVMAAYEGLQAINAQISELLKDE